MYYVYVLKSKKDGKYYTGYTENLERRIQEHNRGKSRSVKGRGPFEVVWVERYDSKSEAMRRERVIKKYKGGRVFKKLITPAPIV